MLYIWNHCTLSFRSYSRLRNSRPRNSRDFAAQILSLTDFRAKERLLAVEIFTHTINNYWTLLSQIAIIIINCKFVFYWIFSGSEAICHFSRKRRKAWFRLRICSKTQLDDIAHEQTITCRQLFAGHVVGFRPMKRKNNWSTQNTHPRTPKWRWHIMIHTQSNSLQRKEPHWLLILIWVKPWE